MRQFQQQQLEQLDALLANYNWSSVFNTSGIDRKVNTFLQITENMISEYFPEKTVRIYSKDKPFMTSKIKRLIRKRNIKKTQKSWTCEKPQKTNYGRDFASKDVILLE